MIIRKAKKKDIDGIYAVFLELAKSEDSAAKKIAHYLYKMRKRKKEFENNVKNDLLKDIRKRNTLFLVAEINNEIIAYALASIFGAKDNFFDIPSIGYFNALTVKNKYRKKGIGSKLNKSVEDWFKKNNCRHIYLEVFESNTASKIYERWGYKDTVHKMWKKL